MSFNQIWQSIRFKKKTKPRLQSLLAMSFGAMSIATVVVVGGVIKFEAERHLTRIVHRELTQVSQQAADRVSKFMVERSNDAELLAGIVGRSANTDNRTKALADLINLYPKSISWAGYVDLNCNVINASDQRFVGWNIAADQCNVSFGSPKMSSVHPDTRLQTTPLNSEDPMTFITMSHPVKDAHGLAVGFVMIELKTYYLDTILSAVPIEVAEGHPTESFIISKNVNRVLVGEGKQDMAFDEGFMERVSDPKRDAFVAWPDGDKFIAGSAPTRAIRDYPNPNWIVVSRAVKDDAFAVANQLSNRIFIWGAVVIGIALLLGLFLAHRLGNPLRALTVLANDDDALLLTQQDSRYVEIDELNAALAGRFQKLQAANDRANIALQDRENALADREALLKEVHHRVKNNLQVIISLMRLQGSRVRHNPAGKALLERLTSRVQVLGWLYSKLYEKAIFENIDSRDILEPLLQQIQDTYPSQVTIAHEIDNVSLGFDQTLVLGMLTIEVVTNAVQHAYARIGHGEVQVSLKRLDDHYLFTVDDQGTGYDTKQKYPGIGLTLSQRMAIQLGGQMSVQSSSEGTSVRVPIEIVLPETPLPGAQTATS